jgi:hypothetical protein
MDYAKIKALASYDDLYSDPVANARAMADILHAAPGDGEMHAQWCDKPHRVVYDACAVIRAQADALDALRAEVATLRAERDARPDITRRDACGYVEYHRSMGMADDVHAPMKRIDAALRSHAAKVVTR